MRLTTASKFLLLTILVFLPVWPAITPQLTYYFGAPDYFSTIVKYSLITSLIFCLGIVAISPNRTIPRGVGTLLLICYFLIITSHIIGYTEPILVLEGLRHEFLYLLMGLLLLTTSLSANDLTLLKWQTIEKIFLYLGLPTVFFAFWQYFDPSLLESIYRTPIDDIRNIELSSGYRLTSILLNPINLGGFIIILFLFIQLKHDRKKINIATYLVLAFLILMLNVGTLSRASVITFVLIFIFSNLYGARIGKLLFIIASTLMISALIYIYIDVSPIQSRFNTLFLISTYLENARILNWVNALRGIDAFGFFWGHGLGTSSPDGQIVQSTSAVMIENSFISIFYQYGIVGLLFFMLILWRFIFTAKAISHVNMPVGKFFLAFVLFFSLMSLGNDFNRNFPFNLYFWLFFCYSELFYRNRQSGT